MSYSIWGRIKARTENQGGAGWRESMPKNRRGCQNPTKLVKRPYKKSIGEEAVDLYNSTGRKCQRWQALLMPKPRILSTKCAISKQSSRHLKRHRLQALY